MSKTGLTTGHLETLERHDCIDDIGGVFALNTKERSLCETLHAWGFLDLVRVEDKGPLYRTNDAGRAAMDAARSVNVEHLIVIPEGLDAVWAKTEAALMLARGNSQGALKAWEAADVALATAERLTVVAMQTGASHRAVVGAKAAVRKANIALETARALIRDALDKRAKAAFALHDAAFAAGDAVMSKETAP